MGKEWRALCWTGAFDGLHYWVMSRRKLDDEEFESLRNEKVSYDFMDTLGISGDGCMFAGALTIPGAKKCDLREIVDNLNKGKKTLADLFNIDEED